MTPAQAASRAVSPKTLITYETGANNTYGYRGWCNGTGSTSYRVIAGCNNGYGVGRWDGDRQESYATCHVDGNTWNLTENWGYLLCTNNGTGAVDDVKAPSQDRILRRRILRRSLHQEEMNG